MVRLLNIIKAQEGEGEPKPKKQIKNLNELMYVNINLNGKRAKAMIDLVASHNFNSKEKATRPDLDSRKALSK